MDSVVVQPVMAPLSTLLRIKPTSYNTLCDPQNDFLGLGDTCVLFMYVYKIPRDIKI